jgi:hypothetical protein
MLAIRRESQGHFRSLKSSRENIKREPFPSPWSIAFDFQWKRVQHFVEIDHMSPTIVYSKYIWLGFASHIRGHHDLPPNMGSALLIFLDFCVVLFFVLFVFVLFLVRPMLSMSLDCQFLITPPLFCNLYFQKVFLGRYQLLVEKNSVNCAQMTKDGIGN